MPTKFVHYPLRNGYLDNWLVAGPQIFEVNDKCDEPEQVARLYADSNLGIDALPVERGPLTAGLFKMGDFTGSWEYFACDEDHRVDQSGTVSTCTYLRSWAFSQLYSKEETTAILEITSPGSVRVWLNGVTLDQHQQFAGADPKRFSVPVVLKEGLNPLFIRFENLGAGIYNHYFTARVSLPVSGAAIQNVEVRIPSLIKSIGRRNRLETSFHSLYLDRDIYSLEQQIRLHWPPAKKASQKDEKVFATIRLLNHAGRIYAEAEVDGTPGDQLVLGLSAQFPEGRYDVLLMPRTWEYYEQDLRIAHKISLWNSGRKRFAEEPTGTFESRKQEALEYASRQEQGSVEREMARMALSRWDRVEEQALLLAVERVTQRSASSLMDLLSLLGLQCRFGGEAQYPENLKAVIETAALGFRYSAAGEASGHGAESRPLLVAACQILAGQLYPDRSFLHGGQSGKELRQMGEQMALHWLRQRAAWGFAEWGSEPGFVETLAGLAYLIDLAETEPVWEMAAALMDKLLFTIALNSYKGLYGGTGSMVGPLSLKGGTQSPLSAVAYLMWGQGNLTSHLPALVSLACNQNYHMPDLFAEIATHPPEELWSKERHTTGGDEEGINQVAYKTPDYHLSSAQMYRAGEHGRGEHVWQATLGPDAIVFTNHPGSSGESDAHLPGYWRGNGVLPAVAQWKDALVCLYQLPETVALGFTHAYFPTFAFDEYLLRDGWAFARKGNAYLALTAASPIELLQSGPRAYRELRSHGHQNAWFCQLGRQARDGSFVDFQKKIIALQFAYQDGRARCQTTGGDQLELDWQGSFYVNQTQQPLSGFPHYENVYTTVAFPCNSMEIHVGGDGLRLNLE